MANVSIAAMDDTTVVGWESGPTGFSRTDATSATFTGELNTTLDVNGASPAEMALLAGVTSAVVSVDNTQTLTNKTLTSPVLNTGVSGTAVLDDDTFGTATDTTLATSESIKAYVDSTGGGDLMADGTVPLTADWNVGLFDITAVEFKGNLVGTATTATTATNITVADTTSATTFPVVVDTATGDQAPLTDGALTYDASAGTLGATLSTAAQPNITSLGTLTTLTVDNITINGDSITGSAATTISTGAGDLTLAPTGSAIVYSGSAGAVTAAAGADDLVVENSDNCGITLLSPDSSPTNVIFGSPSDSVGAYLAWTYDSKLLTIASATASGEVSLGSGNASEAVRVDAAGNVGIGTSAPDAKLDVRNGTSDTEVRIHGYDDGAGLEEYLSILSTTSLNTISTGAGGGGTANPLTISTGQGDLTLSPFTGIAQVVATSGSAVLAADNSSGSSKLYLQSSNSQSYIGFTSGNLNIGTSATVGGAITNKVTINASGNLVFNQSSIITTATGKITVTSPAAQDLNFNCGGGFIFGDSDSGNATRMTLYSATGNMAFAAAATISTGAGDLTLSPTDDVIVAAGIKLGIGIAAPSAALDVLGRARIGATVQPVNQYVTMIVGERPAEDDYATIIINPTTTETRGWTLSVYDDGTTSQFFHIYDDTTDKERIRITNAGNVGIGTPAPVGTLDLANGTSTAELRIHNDYVASTSGEWTSITYAADVATITTEADGTGTARPLTISTGQGDLTLSPAGKTVISSGSPGTFTPTTSGDELLIQHSDHTGLTIASPDAKWSQVFFASPTTTTGFGAIAAWNHSTTEMRIGTNVAGGFVAIRSGAYAEVGRFDDNSTAGNTRFMLYDVDNATMERVSVGAADSGGAGYKVLRIPN